MADRNRRRSLNILSSLKPLTPLTAVSDASDAGPSVPASPPTVLKKRNQIPSYSSPSASPTGSPISNPEVEWINSKRSSGERVLTKRRPGSLNKTRPASLFGSLRSLKSLPSEDEGLVRLDSTPGSVRSAHSGPGQGLSGEMLDIFGGAVLHHGEVQCTAGIFRKKNQYLVLTETHLVKFKTHGRAAEVFTTITQPTGKAVPARHSRMSSSGSLPELYTPDSYSAVRLNHIIAVHRLDDGRPYFSIEIAYTDGKTKAATAMVLQLHDPREAELWMSEIRSAAEKARLLDPFPLTQDVVEYAARVMEQDRDYDIGNCSIFQVVQRATKSGFRSSTDDLAKLTSNTCILAIGVHKIHLIPFLKSPRNASSTSLAESVGVSHGIMTLTHVSVQSLDDKFELNFRVPLQRSSFLCLASVNVTDIALRIRLAADYLRPEWLEQPFTWNVPQSLDEKVLPVSAGDGDYASLDRTLVAYCAGYGLDTHNIKYSVEYVGEDAPIFQLLPPSDGQRQTYSLLELLAIMRALRYNESFKTISFAYVNLDILSGMRDHHGWEHVPWTTKSGEPLLIADQEKSRLLVQEVQALALKSSRLRRLDFSFCLSKKASDSSPDEGSGICEALFPLCSKQLTNVDWVVLNGIHLADADIDFLYAAGIKPSSHFRAIELRSCGLMDRSMDTVLRAISHQGSTLESLNLSGNPSRIVPQSLEEHTQKFNYIRKIDLSCMSRSSGPEPLIPANVLLRWKLEELNLSGIAMNAGSLDALSNYLKSPQSDTLRELQLNKCQLTGSGVASLFRAMHRGPASIRYLHFYASENRIEQHHEKFVHAVSRSVTPRYVTMRMLEYSHEHYFGELMDGLAKNRSLQFLDISKASLPVDASDGTSEALRRMFTKNRTLEILDISGEEAHLEAVHFGIGLNHALTGLKKNRTLRVLLIEHQKLGLQGVSTLASVLEENRGLREIHCENNDVNLQAFTVLVNSMERNTTVLYLPAMDNDRFRSLKKVDQEIDNLRTSSQPTSTRAAMKKTLGAAMMGQRSFTTLLYDRSKLGPYLLSPPKAAGSSSARTSSNDKEAKAVVGSLAQQWEREDSRLRYFLQRNWDLMQGISTTGRDGLASAASGEALSDGQVGKEVAVGSDPSGHGYEDSSSDGEDLLDVDDKDDIQGALMMMKKGLRI